MDKHPRVAVILVASIALAGLVSGLDPASADSYAEARIATAFQVVADMPPVAPPAEKGDLLPIGCAGPLWPEVAAECIDTAYEVPSEPSVVVETRTGPASSELMRLDAVLVAEH